MASPDPENYLHKSQVKETCFEVLFRYYDVRISIKSAARLSLTSAYWQEVSADRQCCTQARNAMMANAAATVLINSNKSLLFDELQAVEDEDDDILMA